MHATPFLAAHGRRTTGLPASGSCAASRTGKHRIGIAFVIFGHFKVSGFSAWRRLFDFGVHIDGFAGIVGEAIALVAGLGSRSSNPRYDSGFNLPNHHLTARRNAGLSDGYCLRAFAAVFVQDPDRSSASQSI